LKITFEENTLMTQATNNRLSLEIAGIDRIYSRWLKFNSMKVNQLTLQQGGQNLFSQKINNRRHIKKTPQ
jgi:hypothetical protein